MWMWFPRLLAQIAIFLERFAIGKLVVWLLEHLVWGGAWMLRGMGQVIVAVTLLIAGQQAAPALVKPAPTTVSGIYGVMVSLDEAKSLAYHLWWEDDPIKMGGSIHASPRVPVMWTISNGRKFWVLKDHFIDKASGNGQPSERSCYRLMVMPVVLDREGHSLNPKPFCKDETEKNGCEWAWPQVVEQCRMQDKYTHRYWWG